MNDDLPRWMTRDEQSRIEDLKAQMRKLELRKLRLESEVQRIRTNAEQRKANGVPADFDHNPYQNTPPNWLEQMQNGEPLKG